MSNKEHLQFFRNQILESAQMKKNLADSDSFLGLMEQAVDLMVRCFRNDGKVLFCGNGGSAADAQHLAAELSGRFRKNRRPLFAEALHVNTSYLTAVSNDYSYDSVFSRMVQAAGRPGDILIALSTSGNSLNILRAVEEAKSTGMATIGMTGRDGGLLGGLCDLELRIPSEDTARIQEGHMIVGHSICELVEEILFPG